MSPLELDSLHQTKELSLADLDLSSRWLASTSEVLAGSLSPGRWECVHEPEPIPGPRFRGYTILEPVGQGGFGAVFRARDELLERDVALKVLLPRERAAGGPPARERLLHEARILARLRHPNIPALYGILEEDGQLALATEYIDGPSYAEILKERGPLSLEEVRTTGLEVCRALAALHGAGIVHGDLKTANLMKDRSGRILLTDFGLSVSWRSACRPVDSGHITGSPLFMAPEQIEGEEIGPRTDLYGLGAVLYNLASGHYPANAASLTELFARIRRGEIVPLEERRPDLPWPFAEVVARALERSPEDRFSSAEEMEKAITRA
ncbi:MAG: serine/threonine protein kinase [Planctomycetes bacterium]|nr:serine/threonine protein kinase [Planctomycetota bacterium]